MTSEKISMNLKAHGGEADQNREVLQDQVEALIHGLIRVLQADTGGVVVIAVLGHYPIHREVAAVLVVLTAVARPVPGPGREDTEGVVILHLRHRLVQVALVAALHLGVGLVEETIVGDRIVEIAIVVVVLDMVEAVEGITAGEEIVRVLLALDLVHQGLAQRGHLDRK